MTRACWVLAVPLLAMTPAFGRVPELNAKALCEARSAGDRLMRSTPVQTVAECERDESDAKLQLTSLWDSIPARTRTQCIGEARALGTTSYLDYLICMKMTEDMKSIAKADTGKP